LSKTGVLEQVTHHKHTRLRLSSHCGTTAIKLCHPTPNFDFDGGSIVVYFRNRLNCLDELSERFLGLLVALGGYCTALQGQELMGRSGNQARARLKALDRLGFLRRITRYPIVYQVTKSTTRLLKRDSSSRRRHTLATVQARLLGVHFYLEARAWPAEFVLDHEKKIEVFTDLAGCPPTVLPQRGGKPYLRDHMLLWQPDARLAIAMIDPPQPGVLMRLTAFIRQFQPLLRYLRLEPDLLIVTSDKGCCRVYEGLMKRHRAILKLGLGELCKLVKPYCVKPPVPTLTELSWPKAENDNWFLEWDQDFQKLSRSGGDDQQICELIED
jgi:hypothetical protein